MKQTEIGMIPDDWEVKNIGTTCNVFTGGEVPLKYSKDKNEVFKYPIYSNGRDVYGYYTGFVIGDDSVCISSIGENTGDVFFYKGEFTPVIRLKVVVPKSNKISTKYLYYYLKAHKIDGTKNGGIPNINANDVKILNFPLPPTLAEQQKIAKALSDVDNVITTLEKLITKKKNLKQGTMQQLLTGKKRLPGFAPTVVEPVETTKFKQTEIGEIPEDWEVKELGEVAKNFTGLTFSPDDVCDYGTLVLRSSNIQNDMLSFNDNVYVNMNIPERAIAHTGDILICVRNGSKRLIGKSALITESANNCAFGAFMTILRTELLNQQFLFYVWQSDLIQKQIEESMGATINQITNKDIRHYLIAYPKSNAEQTAIANVLSSMDKEIEALETKLGKYRNLKTGMMQQLLTGKIRLM